MAEFYRDGRPMKYFPEDGTPIPESMSLCVYDPEIKAYFAPPWDWKDEFGWDAETVRRKTQEALEWFRRGCEDFDSAPADPITEDEPEEPFEEEPTVQPFVLGAERKVSRPKPPRKSNAAQKSLFSEPSDEDASSDSCAESEDDS